MADATHGQPTIDAVNTELDLIAEEDSAGPRSLQAFRKWTAQV
jgi:hypothetical protein